MPKLELGLSREILLENGMYYHIIVLIYLSANTKCCYLYTTFAAGKFEVLRRMSLFSL